MDNLNSIIQNVVADYGYIEVKFAQMLERRGITRNYFRTLTGVKYDVIDRYYKGCNIAMADLDFLAKACYVLNCKLEDLLEYHPPENT